MTINTLREHVRKFVIHMTIAPEEFLQITPEEATLNMKEWKKASLYWPKGMTPEMLSAIWNTEII